MSANIQQYVRADEVVGVSSLGDALNAESGDVGGALVQVEPVNFGSNPRWMLSEYCRKCGGGVGGGCMMWTSDVLVQWPWMAKVLKGTIGITFSATLHWMLENDVE